MHYIDFVIFVCEWALGADGSGMPIAGHSALAVQSSVGPWCM